MLGAGCWSLWPQWCCAWFVLSVADQLSNVSLAPVVCSGSVLLSRATCTMDPFPLFADSHFEYSKAMSGEWNGDV